MFSGAKLAADLVGTADNCAVLSKGDISKEASTKYLIEDEVAYVFLKSMKQEHIFTDRAYISVVGNSAAGTKRMVRRFEYYSNPFREVRFETAGYGITDQDCELKFIVGGRDVSIDIRKQETEKAVHVYRILTSLASFQERNSYLLTAITSAMNLRTLQLPSGKDEVSTTVSALNSATITDVLNLHNQMVPVSYKHIFEQYLG